MSCLTLSLLILAIGPGDSKGTPMTDPMQNNNRFAIDLYARLRDKPGNLFFSPYSISTALAMAYAGARDETAREMAKVLDIDQAADAGHRAFGPLDAGGSDRGFRLGIANRLWGMDGFRFRPEYLDLTRVDFGAELARVNFADPEPVRRQINAWVEQQTQGKIKDLIQAGDLNPLTRLVLTNAIYFKGEWSSPFEKALTKEDAFYVTTRNDVRVPMMQRKADFKFFEEDGLKAIELPYGKGELVMDIILPEQVEGLRAIEERLSPENLSRWFGGFRNRVVEVGMPRFTMTSRFELTEILKVMGMTRAFTPGRADFSGMSSEAQLSISAVIHQTFVDVNEQGTEAAAATAVAIRSLAVMVPKPTAVFRADHPFLYLIRDVRSGSILFLGRVTNPTG